MEGGRALGSGGLVIEDGEGRAWAFLSTALRGRPLLLHRTAKRALPALMQHYELTSIVAEAHADFVSARRWLGRLGFHFEECLPDRKSVGEGKSVSVRVDLGGRRITSKKRTQKRKKT